MRMEVMTCTECERCSSNFVDRPYVSFLYIDASVLLFGLPVRVSAHDTL